MTMCSLSPPSGTSITNSSWPRITRCRSDTWASAAITYRAPATSISTPSRRQDARYADGTPTAIYTRPSTRPNAGFGRISLFDSGADSVYHGGFVQLTKRFAQNFQLLANYTWSKVIDTVPDATSVVVGGGDDAKVAQNTLLPNLDRAVGDADVPQRFVASGVWDLNYWSRSSNAFLRYVVNDWQISGIWNARTGQPFNPTVGGNADINGDGNTRNDRPPFLGRNVYRLPDNYTLDARVTKTIPLGVESVRMRLTGEAFNLLNRANASNVNRSPYNYTSATRTFTPVATFNAPSASFDPRILQIAVKIEF